MILEYYNFLSEKELDSLDKKCIDFNGNNFDKINKKTSSNYYNRVFVSDLNLDNYFTNIKSVLEKIVDKQKFDLIDFSKNYSWINKVVPETNKNDDFHHDMSYMTAVTYLNNDFQGGEFEYKDINSSIFKIIPEKNKTLIMDEKLNHRVLPVKSGVRYSLVTFFQFIPKEKKTLF